MTMKRFLLLATIFCVSISTVFSQAMQASLGVGTSSGRIKIYVRPTAAVSGTIATFQFNVAIPATVTPAPTLTIMGTPPLGLWTVNDSYVEDGFRHYNLTSVALFNLVLAANQELEVMQLQFSGGVASTDVSLYTLPGGGSGGTGAGNGLFYCSGAIYAVEGQLYYNRGGVTVINENSYTGALPSSATISGVVLPIAFTSFSVQKDQTDALLNWTIENADLFTHHFDVERSTDGVNFEKVGTVPYNTALNGAYSYTDPNVTVLQKSIVYYRIKSVDVNGSSKLTNIKNLRFDKANYNVSVYPNPATRTITLSLNADNASTVALRIFDAAGQQVMTTQVKMQKGLNLIPQDVSKLAAGTYQILLVLDGEKITVPFIKTN